MAGCRLDDLSRWRTQDLIGPPCWASGHGGAGRVSRWTLRDARRVWCLARIAGRCHDQWAVLEHVDRHSVGVLYVTDGDTMAGDAEMVAAIHASGGIAGGRLLMLDLGELAEAMGEMLAATPAG